MPTEQQEPRTPFAERQDRDTVEPASRERLYDEYLDAVLAGNSLDPAVFLAQRGLDDQQLLHQLTAVYAAASIDLAAEQVANSANADGAETLESLPRQLGEFRLLTRLGEGGMGVVFLAEQTALGRQVALKIIRPEYSRSATAAARFEREARAIARLRHPNIVSVYAVGETRGVRYIAMEFVQGRGLDELLRDADAAGQPLPTPTVIRWASQIASALDYAHSHGIVHRDVKPSNIRISPEPASNALLVDFGLARDLESGAATLTDAFVGSPFYVAPEQVARRGGNVDGRADVYSLGVVLYQCLTGRVPFSEGSLEQVLHQILTQEAPPLRSSKIGKSLPRELEIVVHKAMEKDAANRYLTAGEFAADLNAMLEFRPISARPPGPILRLTKWARRNVAAAAALATALVALLVLAGVLTGQHLATQSRQRREASDAISEAARLVEAYRTSRAESEQVESQFELLRLVSVSKYFSAEEDRLYDETEDKTTLLRKQRERDYYHAIDLLSRAERLGASVGEVQNIRARLYLARYFEATLEMNPVEMSMYRDLIGQNDPNGLLNAELTGGSSLSLTSQPPVAEVYLFRMMDMAEVVKGGDRRMVPVPMNAGALPVDPGAVVLRVVRGRDALRENDLIVALNGRPVHDLADARQVAELGEIDATVWHDNSLQPMRLPRGIEVRLTAAPLIVVPQALIGRTPLSAIQLDNGDYIALVQAPGHGDQRITFKISRGADVRRSVLLTPDTEVPSGFVRIYSDKIDQASSIQTWMMEREVTAREYFDFLNDPATLAEIDASTVPIRAPRSRIGETHAPRGHDGRYTIGDEWSWDWPVLGISWHDAQAFASWKTDQAREAGRDETYELPTLNDWLAAGAGCFGCEYVFGNRFRAKWVSSCFSKPKPSVDPVMSFPIDESRFGIYDMSGSVAEWLNTYWQEERGTFRYSGGSWAHGNEALFKLYAGNGFPPDQFSDTIGFRLVMRRGAAAK